MTLDDAVRVLGTFRAGDFASAIETARRLLKMDGSRIRKSHNPVPTANLKSIYEVRASLPDALPHLAQQAARLAAVAGRFPDERWYIHNISNGWTVAVMFSNEEGAGRACLEYHDVDPNPSLDSL